jgi:hypothetical protein
MPDGFTWDVYVIEGKKEKKKKKEEKRRRRKSIQSNY